MPHKDKGLDTETATHVALMLPQSSARWTPCRIVQDNGTAVAIEYRTGTGSWKLKTVPSETVGRNRAEVLDKLRTMPDTDPEGTEAAETTPYQHRQDWKANERKAKSESENGNPAVRLWNAAAKRWHLVPRHLVPELDAPETVRLWNPNTKRYVNVPKSALSVPETSR